MGGFALFASALLAILELVGAIHVGWLLVFSPILAALVVAAFWVITVFTLGCIVAFSKR